MAPECVKLHAGLPLAVAGAAVGGLAGSLAGSAVAKEWVRGEDLSSAMEFDQHRHHAEGGVSAAPGQPQVASAGTGSGGQAVEAKGGGADAARRGTESPPHLISIGGIKH